LNAYYESWIETYKNGRLLVINVDDIDFLNNKKDLGAILEKIDADVNGLF
jgi:deoxyadenosine/deoxycytidine kinase